MINTTFVIHEILAELLELLVIAIKAEDKDKEMKPLGLQLSWVKTMVQALGGFLDETVQSVHACCKDVNIILRLKKRISLAMPPSHFKFPCYNPLQRLAKTRRKNVGGSAYSLSLMMRKSRKTVEGLSSTV